MVDCRRRSTSPRIVECLGTKALVADAMRALTGTQLLRPASRRTRIAMAINDLITVGATPLVGAGLLGRRRQRLVRRRRSARTTLVAGWQARLRRLRRGLGRRRDAGAGRRRRRRAHRPGGLVRRPRATRRRG
ncbi:MAG: hypothetical protein MZW92_48130 [Comamonadaceae bacterium]|nr:hypothetical protein [Comamonadaceae bacterium]